MDAHILFILVKNLLFTLFCLEFSLQVTTIDTFWRRLGCTKAGKSSLLLWTLLSVFYSLETRGLVWFFIPQSHMMSSYVDARSQEVSLI